MYTSCTIKGKHRCEDNDEVESNMKKERNANKTKRVCHSGNCTKNEMCTNNHSKPSSSTWNPNKLRLDISRAELLRKAHENREKYISSQKLSKDENPESKKNEKRNFSPNEIQIIKAPKLEPQLNKNGNEDIENIQNTNPTIKTNINKQQNSADFLLDAIVKSCTLQSDDAYDFCFEKRMGNSIAQNVNTKFKIDRMEKKLCRDVYCDLKCVHGLEPVCLSSTNQCANAATSDSDISSICDNLSEKGDIFNIKHKVVSNFNVDSKCDSPIPTLNCKKMKDISNINSTVLPKKINANVRQKISFENFTLCDTKTTSNNENLLTNGLHRNKLVGFKTQRTCKNSNPTDIPSFIEQEKFRKSFDNAASMVFHSRTGLPLTSSPAPVRRGKSSFDFDSSINSVQAIKRYVNKII